LCERHYGSDGMPIEVNYQYVALSKLLHDVLEQRTVERSRLYRVLAALEVRHSTDVQSKLTAHVLARQFEDVQELRTLRAMLRDS
jgi:hypothetical protein